MITGFNTDVEHEGVVYHVQTEDKGLSSPLILSLVYSRGEILASKRSPYEDLIARGFTDEALAERLKRQHLLICAAIRAGRIEELKRMGGQTPAASTDPEAVKPKPRSKSKTPPAKPGDAFGSDTIIERAPVDFGSETIIERASPEFGSDMIIERGSAQFESDMIIERGSEQFGSDTIIERGPAQFESDTIIERAPVDFGSETILERATSTESRDSKEESDVGTPGFEQEEDETEITQETVISRGAPHGAPTELPAETDAYSIHDQRRLSPLGELPLEEGVRLTLLNDRDFRAGQTVTLRIMVSNITESGEKPLSGITVSVKVLGTSFRPQIYSVKTKRDGLATVTAQIPDFTSGRAAILIRVVANESEAEMRRVIHPA